MYEHVKNGNLLCGSYSSSTMQELRPPPLHPHRRAAVAKREARSAVSSAETLLPGLIGTSNEPLHGNWSIPRVSLEGYAIPDDRAAPPLTRQRSGSSISQPSLASGHSEDDVDATEEQAVERAVLELEELELRNYLYKRAKNLSHVQLQREDGVYELPRFPSFSRVRSFNWLKFAQLVRVYQ